MCHYFDKNSQALETQCYIQRHNSAHKIQSFIWNRIPKSQCCGNQCQMFPQNRFWHCSKVNLGSIETQIKGHYKFDSKLLVKLCSDWTVGKESERVTAVSLEWYSSLLSCSPAATIRYHCFSALLNEVRYLMDHLQ